MTHSPRQLAARFDLAALNQRFELANPRNILRWCVENVPKGLVQASAFSVDDTMIADTLYRDLKQQTPVVFIDTLHHFPETLELAAKAKEIYNLNLKVYRTLEAKSRKAFAAKYGDALWEKNLTKFREITKIEPLQRALTELKAVAWITSKRRDGDAASANLPIFEVDKQQRLKINPLANWTRRESWAYVFEHDVIYNPLYDQGFAEIDDAPLAKLIKDEVQVASAEAGKQNAAFY